MKQNLNRRWLYLVLGTLSMLFAGIIYGWSILKAPFAAWWEPSQLALNFTITMTTFCIGGFLGAKISKKFGILVAILCAAVLSCAGFMTASGLDGKNILMLYLTYGVLAGLGIGIAYNAVISTVNAWFPDKKGLCSGCLMMGFGASSLIIGNLASSFMEKFGWQKAYILLGAALGKILYPGKLSLLPRFPTKNRPIRLLTFCGRHALPLYLLHQPVLLVFLETLYFLGEKLYES
jgi:OFA family oxalate/formate antiporter-like MFS transporter